MSLILLTVFGFFLSIWAMSLAGAFFLTVPTVEFLFPFLSFAQIMALFKFGSLGWGISGLYTTWPEINWRHVRSISSSMVVGSAIGVYLSNQISKDVVPYVIIGAILFIELGLPRMGKLRISQNRLFLPCLAFFIGIYGSSVSAGLGLLTVSLYRLYYPDTGNIVYASIQARTTEFVCVFITLAVHLIAGNIVWGIALPFFLGTLVGGFFWRQAPSFVKKTVEHSAKISALSGLFSCPLFNILSASLSHDRPL